MTQTERESRSYATKRKIVVVFLLVILAMTALPVFGVFGNSVEFWGPLPMTLSWTYLWYAGVNVAGFLIYFWLFKPWSENVMEFLAENDDDKDVWRDVKRVDDKVSKEEDV